MHKEDAGSLAKAVAGLTDKEDKDNADVNIMCNLSEVLIERAIERGMKQGIEQERIKGLIGMIKTVRSLVGDDFERVSQIIRQNENYAQISDNVIRDYWNQE